MAGYLIFHERFLKPNRPNGFEPNPDKMGFLDYMRELKQETFPFRPNQRIMVMGLEEVLLDAGERRDEVEAHIYSVLSSRANELCAKLNAHVQVVFRHELKQGEDFWFEGGIQHHVSLRRIFDSPTLQADQDGNEFYFAGFNLT
jgi:hypothetical protein